jgi:hypothetical protein
LGAFGCLIAQTVTTERGGPWLLLLTFALGLYGLSYTDPSVCILSPEASPVKGIDKEILWEI